MIKKIFEERNQLEEANSFLQDHIKVKELYKQYLDSVYAIGLEDFSQVDDVIKRSQALFEKKYTIFYKTLKFSLYFAQVYAEGSLRIYKEKKRRNSIKKHKK